MKNKFDLHVSFIKVLVKKKNKNILNINLSLHLLPKVNNFLIYSTVKNY